MHGKLGVLGVVLGLMNVAPAAAQTFTLGSEGVSGGEGVKITFSEPLPEAGKRHWVCLVKAGEADSAYGVWSYVDVGATEAELKAPEVAGDYEVRLHSNYPDKSNNVIHRQAIKVSGLGPTGPEGIKLVLAAESAPVDQQVEVTFPGPLVPQPEEKFWVCIVMADAPDEEQGLWTMVNPAATEVTLPAPTCSGKHEVRLHGNYPTKTTNVVHRLALEVTGAEDTKETNPGEVEATLGAASIAHGSKPTVKFSIPLRPRTGEKFWVGLTSKEVPETAQGLWVYVEPGKKEVTLPAPISTGPHRVQVHANYPKKSRYPIAVLDLEVTGTPEQAPTDVTKLEPSLVAGTIKVGEKPVVDFGAPLLAFTGERFWVTVIPKDKADSEWGQYTYIDVGASKVELPAPEAAGDYEVRLHARYPTESSNVVQRLPLKVE